MRLGRMFVGHSSTLISSVRWSIFLTKSTHFSNSNFSLIDQIFTNISIIVNRISDHFMTFSEIPFKRVSNLNKLTKHRNFSQVNILAFKNALMSLSWENVRSWLISYLTQLVMIYSFQCLIFTFLKLIQI